MQSTYETPLSKTRMVSVVEDAYGVVWRLVREVGYILVRTSKLLG